jgi:hypothetical protein
VAPTTVLLRRGEPPFQVFLLRWIDEVVPDYGNVASFWSQVRTSVSITDSVEAARRIGRDLLRSHAREAAKLHGVEFAAFSIEEDQGSCSCIGRAPADSLPASLPRTPGIEAGLATLGPETKPILEYKLGVPHRLRGCLDGHDVPAGSIREFFHFLVDTEGAATGSAVELLDSALPEGKDERIVDCLTEAHHGFALRFQTPPGDADFAWATTVTFPLEQDFAPRFVQSDGAITR